MISSSATTRKEAVDGESLDVGDQWNQTDPIVKAF